MPAQQVLTGASTMTCSPLHLGAGQISIPASPLLTVDRQGVLAMPVGPVPVAGCTQPIAPGPPATAPCSTVTVTAGAASLLRVGGVPVLLADTFAANSLTGLPLPVYVVAANQLLLKAA